MKQIKVVRKMHFYSERINHYHNKKADDAITFFTRLIFQHHSYKHLQIIKDFEQVIRKV